jgi:hypothetical protein
MASETDFSKLTKEEAINLLEQSVKGNNVAVVNPALVKRLLELGVEFTVKEGETIGDFFKIAQQHAEDLVSHLPAMPNWLEYQFRRPYYEARCALLVGLYGASITLSAIMLEYMLKWTAFCVEATESPNGVAPDRWQSIEEKVQFGDAIGYAKRWGLIDKPIAKKLHAFRDQIRNVQGHQLIHKATNGVAFPKSTVVDFSKETCDSDQSLSAHTNPTLSAIAKEKMDEQNALKIFLFVHSCMEHLFSVMNERITNFNQKKKAENS